MHVRRAQPIHNYVTIQYFSRHVYIAALRKTSSTFISETFSTSPVLKSAAIALHSTMSSPSECHGPTSTEKVNSPTMPSAGITRSDAAPMIFSRQLFIKLDFRLMTPMVFIIFLSLMGRANIGNALIQDLPADLKLTSTKIFVVTVMPLIMLILFEIPSNLIMRWLERKWGLSYIRYLSLITVGLGKSR